VRRSTPASERARKSVSGSRQLEDLAKREREMYAMDHAKDQVMTTLKLALANLVLWTRDRYFPASYAQATWHRLEPFFRLPGRIRWGSDRVQVELGTFNDCQLTRDLVALCARVEQTPPHLPDGRRLVFSLPCASGSPQPGSHQKVA
jgi:hypothetical protein